MRRVLLLVVVLLAGSLLAAAQSSGYDVFQTGSGAAVDLSSMNLGNVALQGVAIPGSGAGNADTIMFRPQAVPSGGGTIPVNLWALFMKSVSPVNLNGTSADVYVTVNATGGAIATGVLPQPDALSASTGTITVYPNSQGTGGTFDSSITINADIIFVTAGQSVTNPANYLAHQPAPAITLSQTGSSYSTTAPSGYPISASVPLQPGVLGAASTSVSLSSGGFFPKPVHTGPHPVVPAQNTGGGGCGPVPTTTATVTPNSKSGTKNSGPAPAPTGEIFKCLN
jgi:hypothetical protein